MELGLEQEEAVELRRLLTGALGELSSELADTDNPQYIRELRTRQDLLRSVDEKLDQAGIKL